MKTTITGFALGVLVFSQLVFSQVTLQIGGGVGIASPTTDYNGSTIGFFSGTSYGLGSGLNLQAKARVGLLGFNVFGIIDYVSMSGEGEGQPGRGVVKNSHKILSLKAGPEWNIGIPLFPVDFYVNGFLSFNSISGSVTFQGLTNVPSGKYDLESTSRVGAGIGGGVLYNINPLITIDLGIQYNLYNLFGKQYSIENPSSHPELDVYTSLNDDKDPLFESGSEDHFVGDSRAMNAWQFTLTVMFGL